MSKREKPLRVAYFLKEFPLLSETFVLNEIIELKRQGLDIVIFSLRKPNESVIHEEAEELARKTHYIESLVKLSKFKKAYTYLYSHLCFLVSNPLRYLRAIWFACTRADLKAFRFAGYCALVLRKFKIDHIHTHFAVDASEFAMMISMISGIPYSFTPHAYDIYINPKLIKEKINFAEFVITKTEYNKEFLKAKYPGIDVNKIHVLHYGIDVPKFSPRNIIRVENSFLPYCLWLEW